MVGKDEEKQQHLDEGLARVRLIADKKRHLEETADLVSFFDFLISLSLVLLYTV